MARRNVTRRDKDEIERLREIFESFQLDADKDGKIPFNELRLIISDPEKTTDLERQQNEAILAAADENRDGALQFREFALLVTGNRAQGSRYRRFLYTAADMVIATDQRPQVHGYLSKYSCCPPPIFMLLISILEVAVFVYYALTTKTKINWMNGCAGCWMDGKPGPLMMAPTLRAQAWRFLTYMFLHAGLEHLLVNVLMQLILGIPLELVHKVWRIAPLYLVGVVLGGMFQYILDPDVYLVGASGGVYALIIAHLANVILNWVEMPFRWIRVGFVALFVGLDWGHALYRRFAMGVCDNTSYTAHLGGAITGLLLGVVLLKNIREIRWETILKWTALGFYVVLFFACVIFTVIVQPMGKPLIDISCE